jgi:hypothetical protein
MNIGVWNKLKYIKININVLKKYKYYFNNIEKWNSRLKFYFSIMNWKIKNQKIILDLNNLIKKLFFLWIQEIV